MKNLKTKELLNISGRYKHPGDFFEKSWDFIRDPFGQDG